VSKTKSPVQDGRTDKPALSNGRQPTDRGGVFRLPTAGLGFDRLAPAVPACVEALQNAAKTLGVTAEQESAAMDDFLKEVGRHAPQIAVTLFVRSQLPHIRERAVKHYRYKRGMSPHDAEDRASDLVLKILTALTGAGPRDNVGAWVAKIRSNLYWDHRRDQVRRARGMERLEKAFNAMRI
jgi:hypothetical protein